MYTYIVYDRKRSAGTPKETWVKRVWFRKRPFFDYFPDYTKPLNYGNKKIMYIYIHPYQIFPSYSSYFFFLVEWFSIERYFLCVLFTWLQLYSFHLKKLCPFVSDTIFLLGKGCHITSIYLIPLPYIYIYIYK